MHNKDNLAMCLPANVIRTFINEYFCIMFKLDKLKFYMAPLIDTRCCFSIESYWLLPIPQVAIMEGKIVLPSLFWGNQPSQNNSW